MPVKPKARRQTWPIGRRGRRPDQPVLRHWIGSMTAATTRLRKNIISTAANSAAIDFTSAAATVYRPEAAITHRMARCLVARSAMGAR